MKPGDLLMRVMAGLLLAPWLDPQERAEVLMDLQDLAKPVRERWGACFANIWVLWQLGRYPFYLSGGGRVVRDPGPAAMFRGRGIAEGWVREFRLGARRIIRHPGTSAVIVLTLALGLGASASVFSVLNTLVLRPLPFSEPEDLIRVRESLTVQAGMPPREVSMSPRRFRQLRDRVSTLEDVAAARFRTFTLSGEGEPERVIGLTATWNHFTVLGVTPALGRTYSATEDAPGAPAPVAVISRSLWTRRFGRDPAAVGQELVVNGRPHTVVGVMPEGFRYPYAGELWVPMGIDPNSPDFQDRGLNITARLAPGVAMESVRSELAALSRALAEERPEPDGNMAFTFKTLEEEILEGVPRKVSALLWAAVFVLLIGAANVASMILARLHSEDQSLAVQVALGAGGADLARRYVSEGVILAGSGLLLGMALSGSSVGFLTGLSPVSDLGPYFQNVGVDSRVFLFASLLALASMALASLPTLFHLRKGDFAGRLRGKSISADARRGRWRFLELLVAGEVAVAVLLLIGAGVTVQGISSEWGTDLGLEPEGLYTFGVAPASSGYEESEERAAIMNTLLERIRAVPGVEAAGFTNLNPMRSHGWGAPVWPEGRIPSGRDDVFTLNHRAVSPGYFAAAGTRVVSGRGFLPSDGVDDPGVVVVSEKAAELLWPGRDPLGQRVRLGGAESGGPFLTVVGVAEDVAEFDFLAETWYRPYPQDPRDYNTRVIELFVRGNIPATALIPGVRRAIQETDPDLPVFNVQAMSEILRFERRVEYFATLLLSLFASIGVTLAAVGIYGVLSYTTGRRTREIGLRVALGARRSTVLYEVTASTMGACGLGLVAGLLVSVAISSLLETLVVELPSSSSGVYLLATALALGVGTMAAVGPAVRALKVQPRTALDGD